MVDDLYRGGVIKVAVTIWTSITVPDRTAQSRMKCLALLDHPLLKVNTKVTYARPGSLRIDPVTVGIMVTLNAARWVS
jgi:hypothetical protein